MIKKNNNWQHMSGLQWIWQNTDGIKSAIRESTVSIKAPSVRAAPSSLAAALPTMPCWRRRRPTRSPERQQRPSGSAPAEVSSHWPERSSAASPTHTQPPRPLQLMHAPCNSPMTQWRMSRCCEILFCSFNVLVWIHCNVIYSLLNVVIRYLWIYGCDFRQKRK